MQLICGAAAALFLISVATDAATVIQREVFQAPGWHQARVQVLWDSLGTWVQSFDTTVDLPATLDLTLYDTRDQQVRTTWYDTLSGDTVGTWDDYLYRRGPAATSHYPLYLISPDHDSVWIEVADRATADTTFTPTDTALVAVPIDTTVDLLTSRDNRITLRWFEKVTGDTATATTWVLYQSLNEPAPGAEPPMATLFVSYYRNGRAQAGAWLIVRNDNVATDTVNNVLVGPIYQYAKTNSSGVASVEIPRSYLYHDSLKALYDITLRVGPRAAAEWNDYWIPDQDTVRLTVEN